MTDANTPARGGETTETTNRPAATDDVFETTEPEYSAAGPAESPPDSPAAQAPTPAQAPTHDSAPQVEQRSEPEPDQVAQPVSARASAGEPEPFAPPRPWSVGRSPDQNPDQSSAPTSTSDAASAAAENRAPDTQAPDTQAPERQGPENAAPRSVPPLSPPSSAPVTSSTSVLPDDSALRAAEAARAGTTPQDPAVPVVETASSAAESAADTGDVGDTRIVAANGARSSTAWTPPPAPASPAEYAAATTPTPYAPPMTAVPVAPPTSTTPLTTLGTSPAESLGFTDGIAGGDEGFTPEELAQRRAFRDEMAFRQKQEFAGINFGSAFFGWLAAVGLAGLLYIIAGSITVASGLAKASVLSGGTTKITSLGTVFTTQSLQITALVVFLVILCLSYFVGGFVASRMARFSGLKQGLAVWLWGLVMSIIAAVVLVVIASQSTTVKSLSSGSNLSMSDLTNVSTLVSLGLILVVSVGGALLGGLAGQAFHRRVDRFGIDEV